MTRREYYWAHREETLAAYREWFRNLKNRPELHAKRLAAKRKYYWANRERLVAEKREYRKRYPMMRTYQYWQMVARFETDAKAYAEYRAKDRARRKREAEKRGKIYRGNPSMRIPDWATKGQRIMDTASPWLPENMSPEQNAYARELAIERKEWRIKNGR